MKLGHGTSECDPRECPIKNRRCQWYGTGFNVPVKHKGKMLHHKTCILANMSISFMKHQKVPCPAKD
jgi:hypothetical protein